MFALQDLYLPKLYTDIVQLREHKQFVLLFGNLRVDAGYTNKKEYNHTTEAFQYNEIKTVKKAKRIKGYPLWTKPYIIDDKAYFLFCLFCYVLSWKAF